MTNIVCGYVRGVVTGVLAAMLLLCSMVLVVACADSKPAPEELAARAAGTYYGHLVAGRYDEYVSGVSNLDSVPEDYRSQLVTNAKMFAALQQREHQGISRVEVLRAKTDSLSGQTCVYLMLCFGDSTREEIVVPMVEQGGRWLMR